MPHARHMPQLETYVRRAAEDAIAAYVRHHRLSARHPEESSVWVVPADIFVYDCDMEVAIEVFSGGSDWSLEVALLTPRPDAPDAPARVKRRVLASVTCDDDEVCVDRVSEGVRAFGATLANTLLAVASGQFS